MTDKIPVILDGDPGHDDAIAWVIAGASDKFEILAITTVCGNQTIEKTTYNAGRIAALLNLDVPIAMGYRKPLFRDAIIAPSVHGQSGLDGPELPEPVRETEKMSAVELIADKVKKCDKKVTLIPTGPLTNIAKFLLCYPELKERIELISLMGGGIGFGNWTPAAEFNILADPEAADIVFRSGIPIIMSGINVTEKALVLPEDVDRIKACNTEVSKIVAEWLEFFSGFHLQLGYEGAPVHDAVAVAVLIHPEMMEIRDMYVEVETKGRYTLGATIADVRGFTGKKPNVKVITDIRREEFVELIASSCMKY